MRAPIIATIATLAIAMPTIAPVDRAGPESSEEAAALAEAVGEALDVAVGSGLELARILAATADNDAEADAGRVASGYRTYCASLAISICAVRFVSLVGLMTPS